MKPRLLTASANTGMGLWTLICVGFSQIFGCESQNYKNKQRKVLDEANKDLLDQLRRLPGNFEISEYRVTWSDKLSVTVSALAIESDKEPDPLDIEEEVEEEKEYEEVKVDEPKKKEPVINLTPVKEETKEVISEFPADTLMTYTYSGMDTLGKVVKIEKGSKVTILGKNKDSNSIILEYKDEAGENHVIDNLPSFFFKIS